MSRSTDLSSLPTQVGSYDNRTAGVPPSTKSRRRHATARAAPRPGNAGASTGRSQARPPREPPAPSEPGRASQAAARDAPGGRRRSCSKRFRPRIARRCGTRFMPDQAGLVFVEVSRAVANLAGRADRITSLVTLLHDARPGRPRLHLRRRPARRARAGVARAGVPRPAGLRSDDPLRRGQVGRYMTHEWVAVPETHTVAAGARASCARVRELPPQTDRFFVVDARNVLRGTMPLQTLLLTDPSAPVVASVVADTVTFGPLRAGAARRQRIRALRPRVGAGGRRARQARGTADGRRRDGLRPGRGRSARAEAGRFDAGRGPVRGTLDSALNRWPWLGINLVTAFVASRVIGQFEQTIRDLLGSLAALMPIVASIGGNTGNQTMALMIRLALDRKSGARLRAR